MKPSAFLLSYIQQHILKTHSLNEFHQLHPFDWQLIILTAYLANIDGQFSFFETYKIQQTFKHFFNKTQQELACTSAKNVNLDNINWPQFIKEINSISSVKDRLQVITFLFEIACTDGSLVDKELSFIHQLSKDFDIKEITFLKVLDKYKMWNKTFRSKVMGKLTASQENEKQQQRLRAFTILGLLPHANIDDIKKRYRELMKKHHPDANPHLSSSEMIFHRKQMFKINEAYAILTK